jgi:uncharacterized membrane protein YcaP (DUF421 family)
MYLVLTLIVRLLGKRMSAQMTITEMAVMLTLGAIVSGAMQTPDQGLLTGALVLAAVLLFQTTVNRGSQRFDKLDGLVNGRPAVLLKDGVIELDQLKHHLISHEQLFARLRERGIAHLGQIQRVYLEACGEWSLFLARDARPGLPITPAQDEALAENTRRERDKAACKRCGHVMQVATGDADPCPRCGNADWVAPIRAGTPE